MIQKKRWIALLFGIAAFMVVLFSISDLNSIQVQPPAGYANNPPGPIGTGPLNCTYCHAGLPPQHDSTNFLLQIGLDTSSLSTMTSGLTTYTPGMLYYLRITGIKPAVDYGFELTTEDNSQNGSDVGDFSILDTTTTTIDTAGGCTYVGHHNANNNNQWTFTWTAPASSLYHGPVTFYYVGNDGSGPSANQPSCCDTVYVMKKTITAFGVSGINSIEPNVTGLNIFPNVFAQTFRISFDIRENSRVEADIVAMTGQVVSTIINEQVADGNFNRSFDLGNLAAGIYILKLQIGDVYEMRKIVKE